MKLPGPKVRGVKRPGCEMSRFKRSGSGTSWSKKAGGETSRSKMTEVENHGPKRPVPECPKIKLLGPKSLGANSRD